MQISAALVAIVVVAVSTVAGMPMDPPEERNQHAQDAAAGAAAAGAPTDPFEAPNRYATIDDLLGSSAARTPTDPTKERNQHARRAATIAQEAAEHGIKAARVLLNNPANPNPDAPEYLANHQAAHTMAHRIWHDGRQMYRLESRHGAETQSASNHAYSVAHTIAEATEHIEKAASRLRDKEEESPDRTQRCLHSVRRAEVSLQNGIEACKHSLRLMDDPQNEEARQHAEFYDHHQRDRLHAAKKWLPRY